MRKQASIIFYLWMIGGLAACSLPVPLSPEIYDQNIPLQYETVSAMLTATAAVLQNGRTAVPSIRPTITPPVQKVTDTVLPEVQFTALPMEVTGIAVETKTMAAANVPCDLAHPGRPIDVTVPDETAFEPGEYFSKTWRLVNGGTCAWTRDYAVIWFSGDDVGINHEQVLGVEVEPGKSVDVTVDMIAPQEPGMYQSNWKMRSSDGNLFGIGPSGGAPFWVRIVVIPVDTPTPTFTAPPPTPTQTPVALIQDSRILMLDHGVDFDPGSNLELLEDLVFQRSEEGIYQLAPVQGAKLLPFGETAPGYDVCQFAAVTEETIAVEEFQPGMYLCYRTSGGLPGRLQLQDIDLEKNQINLSFLTWALP